MVRYSIASQKRDDLPFNWTVACVADVIWTRLYICEAVPRSLVCYSNAINELLEGRFGFPFILIGKLTMGFLTDQAQRGPQNKYFGTVLHTDSTTFKFRLWRRLTEPLSL